MIPKAGLDLGPQDRAGVGSEPLTDAILIDGIRIPCALGITSAERKMKRPIRIDLELSCSLDRPGQTDRLADTVDYGAVYELIAEVVDQREYRLVEALGEAITTAILERFPIEIVTITIRKIAPLAGAVDHTGVRLRRARVA